MRRLLIRFGEPAMLTKTTLSALRALLFLGHSAAARPWSPRAIAESLGESPTYLAKVLRHLVRASILKAHRGVAGGVVLHRRAEEITLLMIVEACQGTLLGDFCSDTTDLKKTCAFHQAGAELHRAIGDVLARWNLGHFLAKPTPDRSIAGNVQCWLDPCPTLQSLAATAGPSARRRRR